MNTSLLIAVSRQTLQPDLSLALQNSGSRRVVVSGVNVARRHTRPSQTTPGGIVDKEMSLDVSNVSHLDPKDDKPTRVGFKTLDDGRKVRFAKRSGEVIDN